MNIILYTLIEIERELEYISKCIQDDEIQEMFSKIPTLPAKTNHVDETTIPGPGSDHLDENEEHFRLMPVMTQSGYRFQNFETIIGRNQYFLPNYIRSNYKSIARDSDEFKLFNDQLEDREKAIRKKYDKLNSQLEGKPNICLMAMGVLMIDIRESLNPAIELFLGYNSLPIKVHSKLLKVEALLDEKSISDNIGSIKAYTAKYEIDFNEKDKGKVKEWASFFSHIDCLENILETTPQGRQTALNKAVKDHLQSNYRSKLKAKGIDLWQ